jgi:hypothetical protein
MAERANDFSLAQLWITGGAYNSNDLNTIEAGWQVRPLKQKLNHHRKSSINAASLKYLQLKEPEHQVASS